MGRNIKKEESALVFVVNHMHFGGCQKIVYELIHNLDYKGNIYLISNKGFYSDKLQEKENVIFIDRFFFSYKKMFLEIFKISKSYKKIVLHTHNRKDIFLKFALRSKDTHIHTFHSAYLDKNYLYKIIKPQKAISISKTVQDYLLKYNIESKLIYNGIDVKSTDYYTNNKYNKNKLRLLFVGRLSKEKGILHLLESLRKTETNIGQIELEIKGDGNLLKEAKKIAKSITNCSITFAGYQQKPWEGINNYDLMVIPSLFEGFCLVAVEAASLGIPVVGSDIKALREVLNFLPDNCFFNPSDYNSIISSIEYALANRESLKTLIHEQQLAEKFSTKEMTKQYLNEYKKYIQR